jgi:hypothetical protein
LAPQTRDDRLRRTDCDRPGPARRCAIRGKPYSAEAAEADLRDAQTGFDAAASVRAGVNQGFAERSQRKAKVQDCGVAAQRGR